MKLILKYILLLGLVACNLNNKEVSIEGQSRNVRFNLVGDLTLESETPIGGRIEGELGTVYGVTINKLIDNNESFYLEGVFNSLDDINVELFSDENYVIYFTALRDGTSLGLSFTESNGNIYFQRLFGETDLELINKFIDDERFFYLPSNSIASYLDSNTVEDAFYHALIDRFNGKLSLNNPTPSDSVVTIDLRRHSYGLAIRVENIDANDTLSIDFSSISSFQYVLFQDNSEEYQIRTINDDFIVSDDATVSFNTEFKLRVYDESNVFVRERLLSTQEITGKRNVKRTYVIDLLDFEEGSSGSNRVDINYLDEDLRDEGEFSIGG